MSACTKPSVEIVEVAPRDGFQSIAEPLPTKEKIAIIAALIDAGIKRTEIGSFVSPQAVPQMADIAEIASAFRGCGAGLSVLVPNTRGAELALKHGCTGMVFVLSVSEAHNQANVRRSVAQSLAELRRIVALVQDEAGLALRVNLATAFDCPFTGAVPFAAVRQVFLQCHDIVPSAEFGLCDTTGRANPLSVGRRFRELMDEVREARWAFHGHDTYGMGVANAFSAYQAGVKVLDGSAAGLGGCPFAPGATGNTATEDITFAFSDGGAETGINMERLLQVADRIAALPGGVTGGHLRTVPRTRALSR